GPARARDRLRRRHPARTPGPRGAHHPGGVRRWLRPRRDGPARACVRRGGGRPHRRHGAISRTRSRDAGRVIARTTFWGALGALAWTHAGYPLAMGVLARVRPRPVHKADQTPTVALVVSAHDEEAVIRRRIENALALDYPGESLEIVVASDGS